MFWRVSNYANYLKGLISMDEQQKTKAEKRKERQLEKKDARTELDKRLKRGKVVAFYYIVCTIFPRA